MTTPTQEIARAVLLGMRAILTDEEFDREKPSYQSDEEWQRFKKGLDDEIAKIKGGQ